ncbi:hypothetical protein [Parachitinimonas caeni]|uniref:Uncharacterized protein n=1 Tax=Parachitinimonas caeni TaxID=3031301 RepID=A0ABT7DYY0_9NEIS|nr:hypothetical protein [Parachitinimonas caeni]MDK2125271.1 hypothetical protein [Parachitinimonas caeni]
MSHLDDLYAMHLPDPRLYPRVDPKHPIIRTAMALLTEADAARQPERRLALLTEINRGIEDDAALLETALANAPSQQVYELINQSIETGVRGSGNRWALPFAIPVILVAGVKGKASLLGTLGNIEAIKDLLTSHGVFNRDARIYLSPKLIAGKVFDEVGPQALRRWTRELINDPGAAFVHQPAAPIEVGGDGVFLRYIVGFAEVIDTCPNPVHFGGPVGAWGMPLTKLLGDALKKDGVTLFAIPRQPNSWLAARHVGHFARHELHFQFFASNIIRKIRQSAETPVAVMSAHPQNELRFTLSAAGNSELWEGFVWPLDPLDSVELIQQNASALLRECQIDDIRVLTEVQPAFKDDLPYFPTAHDTTANRQGQP